MIYKRDKAYWYNFPVSRAGSNPVYRIIVPY